MPTKKEFVDFIIDQIADDKARARAMFGEYALYYDNAVVALICDNTLYVKITPATESLAGEDAATGYPYSGAKPAFIVSAEDLEDGERLRALVRACAGDVKKTKKSTSVKKTAHRQRSGKKK